MRLLMLEGKRIGENSLCIGIKISANVKLVAEKYGGRAASALLPGRTLLFDNIQDLPDLDMKVMGIHGALEHIQLFQRHIYRCITFGQQQYRYPSLPDGAENFRAKALHTLAEDDQPRPEPLDTVLYRSGIVRCLYPVILVQQREVHF